MIPVSNSHRRLRNIAIALLLSLPIGSHASPNSFAPVAPLAVNSLDERMAFPPSHVRLEVFFDFYCRHCGTFIVTVLPRLKNQFGKALQVQYVGFPVVEDQSPLAFELYEAARIEGKGEEMVQALFGMLQDDHQAITQPDVQEKIFQQLGLNPRHIAEHLSSGLALKNMQHGIERATHLGLSFTPVVVVEGTYLVIDTSARNLGAVIQRAMRKKFEEAKSNA